ncbi:hypothetical protein PLIIFM63780_007301 [Purpureocillium lilacinum]|uniref:Uncharacterized protein n=1 Tax=Purpureocillium lilacinum TaxID=33203 RepID=A0A179GXL9_PURLI|nr:hypothetical protein VFPBJ_04453 [Purpureocillium lilacinum]GJN73239.1 hypothetical protein PLICBS_007315 [Purpureocillium lilacinum]GJN83752.1 hypothetical protein PLIIFM63780_007301 [Purpureocillium lilacinum]
MIVPTRLSSAILALTSLSLVGGLAITYPEVVPGPGLPSLAELGLTSAELYNMGIPHHLPDRLAVRAATFEPRCGPSEAAYVNVNDIIACYHYLDKLGHQNCATGANFAVSEFCHAGSGHVTGQALNPRGASSYCSDVAIAALYTIDHCTRPDQTVAGFQAAFGNGELIVGCTNVRW